MQFFKEELKDVKSAKHIIVDIISADLNTCDEAAATRSSRMLRAHLRREQVLRGRGAHTHCEQLSSLRQVGRRLRIKGVTTGLSWAPQACADTWWQGLPLCTRLRRGHGSSSLLPVRSILP